MKGTEEYDDEERAAILRAYCLESCSEAELEAMANTFYGQAAVLAVRMGRLREAARAAADQTWVGRLLARLLIR